MTFTDADAQRMLRVVEEQVDRALSRRPRTTYGVVESVNTTTRKAAVYVLGEATASGGFKYTSREPAVGELVRLVIDPRGDRYIEEPLDSTAATFSRLRASATDDLGATSTLHPFQVGASSGNNIAMDNNEIMARSNGVVADLHLNADGGQITVGNNGSAGANNGLKVMRGGVRIGTSSVPSETADLSMMFGADIELYRAAANELRTKTGDSMYGSAVARYLDKTSTQSISNITYTVVSSWSTTPFVGIGVSYDGADELVVDRAGLYLVFVHASFAHSTAGIRIVGFDVNDTTTSNPASGRQTRHPVHASDTNTEFNSFFAPVSLSANDRVCMKVWQNSGSSLNLLYAGISAIFMGYS